MREMDQNPEQQPKRKYRKIISPREAGKPKEKQPKKQVEPAPTQLAAKEGEKPPEPKPQKSETTDQFTRRIEKEIKEAKEEFLKPIAGGQRSTPMEVAGFIDQQLSRYELLNREIAPEDIAIQIEPGVMIAPKDLESYGRIMGASDAELGMLTRLNDEFDKRRVFNNEFLKFKAARGEGPEAVRDVVRESEAMEPNPNWGIYFRKPGVAEAFRQLESRGEEFANPDPEHNQAGATRIQNEIRSDIVTHLQNTLNIPDWQARSAQIIAERLWHVTERDDVYDPGFEHPENFRTKRVLHLEEFAGRPPYNENIPNRHLLLKVDSKGERWGDLGMRDFFTQYRRIFEGVDPNNPNLVGTTRLPDNFYQGRDYGRRHLSLENARLEDFDWENEAFVEALQAFWVDMADADATRKAFVAEGAADKAGLLQDTVTIEKVNEKFADAWTNQRQERPYKFMSVAEFASNSQLEFWHGQGRRDVAMANDLEEYVEGLQSEKGRDTKNLNLEKLWYRYFEETGLSRKIESEFGELPQFDVDDATGIIVSRNVFENLKAGGFEITSEGVARLLLNIHDRETILGAFRANEGFYQTLKYFAGVVERTDGKLVPIEQLTRDDLQNLIQADRDHLNAAQIDSPLSPDPQNPITESIIDALGRIFDDEDANRRDDTQARLLITNRFWENAWGGHIRERNQILILFAQHGLSVSRLMDIYQNIYVKPLRLKLGFYNVPWWRRLQFWEKGNFAYDEKKGKGYDLFDAYCELFKRLKNLKFHMGEHAGQFIVAPEAPTRAELEQELGYPLDPDDYQHVVAQRGQRPHGASPDYVLDRTRTEFESQQTEPVFAFWLGDGMDNLDRFRKGWAGPILMYFNQFEAIERFFLKRSREFLQKTDEENWQQKQFEPGDIDSALKAWEELSPVAISGDQKVSLARTLGATNFDRFLYQAKKLFWGIADEREGKTEHPAGELAVTGFSVVLGFFTGRAAPFITRALQSVPVLPTSFPDVANGFIIGGFLQAFGVPLPVGFWIGTAISKGVGPAFKGIGTAYYRSGPSGWWRAGARNLWRLRNIRNPILRTALLPIAAMSAHDYIGKDEDTLKAAQEDPLTGEGFKPLISFKS